MKRYLVLAPRWRKVWMDLWGNRLRTLLVMLSISVGVFAVGMVYSCFLMFERDLARSWGASAPASAGLYADPFDEELVDSVRSLRGVKEAEGRRNVNVRVRMADGQWKQIMLIAIPDYIKQRVNIVRPLSGDWPPDDGDVLLERSSQKAMAIAPGEWITIETTAGRKRSLKVSGLVHDPTQIPTLFSGSYYGYISMDTLEKLDETRQLDQVNFIVQPWALQGKSTEPIEALGRRAWNKLEQGNTTVFWLQVYKPGEHLMQNGINALILLLAVLGALSLILGSLLLVNTISSILTQQTRQIGILKIIGARQDQIIELYLTLVAVYGLLALFVAAPLGALAASKITEFIAGVFNFDSGGLELPPRVLLLEAAISLLVPLTAALWPIWRGVSITVREAVHDVGISSVSARDRIDRWVDHSLSRFRQLPRPVVLSLRNTFRRKGRLLLTLLTMTVAGTVFMAVFSVRASLYSTLDQAMDYFHYDIGFAFTKSFRASRIEQEVLQVPGVKAVESWGFASGRVLRDARKESEDEASKNVFVMAPPIDTQMIRPKIIDGRWLTAGDENALVVNTDVVKDRPELKVGGPAVIKLGHRRLQFTVVGIAQSTLTGPFAFAPYDWFAGAVQETGRARSVQILAQSAKEADQSALARALEEHLKKNSLRVHHVDVIWEVKQQVRAQFDIITNFLMIMAVLLAIVGALGLTGTMGINVLERTREIGVMRAIGASSLHIGQVFIVEALCIGVLSWLAGVILALPISVLLSRQVGILFLESPLEFSFSILGTAIWLFLSVLLSAAASLLPAWNAARLSVRDVLSYE